MQMGRPEWGKVQDSFLPTIPNPHPKPALSLTHDLLCVLSMDTWWNFGHGFKKKAKQRTAATTVGTHNTHSEHRYQPNTQRPRRASNPPRAQRTRTTTTANQEGTQRAPPKARNPTPQR